LQRGGSPSAFDRLLAAEFAEAAWEAIVAENRAAGPLGLVDGLVRLHNYGGPAVAAREGKAQRMYRLQKVLSALGGEEEHEEQ
jgi:6-phosphofructokinase